MEVSSVTTGSTLMTWQQMSAWTRYVSTLSPMDSALPDDFLSELFRWFRIQSLGNLSSSSSSSVPTSASSETQRQEDAMEFLTFVLDKLHEELLSLESTSSTVSSVLSVPISGKDIVEGHKQCDSEAIDDVDVWEVVKVKNKPSSVWQATTSSSQSSSSSSVSRGQNTRNADAATFVSEPIRVRKVIVDEISKNRAYQAKNSTIINKLFYGIVR